MYDRFFRIWILDWRVVERVDEGIIVEISSKNNDVSSKRKEDGCVLVVIVMVFLYKLWMKDM